MQSQVLTTALERCADPQRARACAGRLQESGAGRLLKKLSAEQARILTALLSGSQTSAELLLAHPDWLAPLLEHGVEQPRRAHGLRRELEPALKEFSRQQNYTAAFAQLRQFRQRQMLRIAARDLAGLAGTEEIIGEISDVADVCIDWVYRLCWEQLSRRLGLPFHLDAQDRWQETNFCVLALGKLGGQELNYSSDVDVMFVYAEEGNLFKARPRPNDQSGKGLANHQFFARLAGEIAAEISRLTPQGTLYRIDLRLRPEGKTGPLARSLSSCENYYAQWGQTWERMMLIKGRPIAGSIELGAEFLEMVQPFRYPRLIGERTLREIAAVKKRLETEIVKAGEMDRNVKLGRGGIREIEFVVQSLQLLHAGRIPFLQGPSTVPTLHKLASYGLLSADDAAALEQAYLFLRNVEHRLQMEADQQTHTIPTERQARERLARLMGFHLLRDFESARRRHAELVRGIYDQILAGDEPSQPRLLPDQFEGAEDQWKQLLARHGFQDPDRAYRMVEIFVNGPGYVHVSQRTVELARELFPKLLALCLPKPAPGQPARNLAPSSATAKETAGRKSLAAGPSALSGTARAPREGQGWLDRRLSDPDRVMVRLDSYIDAYGARATLYELWTHKPALFELLLLLFDRSEFLAERVIGGPDLVDEVESNGRLRRQKSAEQILEDLRHGIGDPDQWLWLRRYHEAELMRIALRDILGLADSEQNLLEMSALAEACLQYALEVVMRQYKFTSAPFCIVGMGKLGGQEVGYGSDLDIVFVTDAAPENLPTLQRAAAELLDLLSRPTAAGIAFHTDARLRPDGEKGLLVNTIETCEEYYRRRAGLWEIQALTRARPVAGNLELGAQFRRLAATLTDFTPANVAAGFVAPSTSTNDDARQRNLAAYTPAWKSEIAKMRLRILTERTPPGKEHLAIKTGRGGLIDAQFLAQTFCLAGGWQEPSTLKALQQACDSGALPRADGDSLSDNYRKLRRIEGVLRRWSFQGETLLPDEPAALNRVAVRCGFDSGPEFMKRIGEIRAAIVGVFERVFSQ
jgi:[glutamine synthetase] adenylyltransferase / [glutamine synthetase]-adenylyl-L-tyrosine phosphorylase